jgi:hypothetical protein
MQQKACAVRLRWPASWDAEARPPILESGRDVFSGVREFLVVLSYRYLGATQKTAVAESAP